MARKRQEPNPLAASRIRAIRQKRGFTLEKFAALIDRDISSLKEYESGRRAVPKAVAKTLAQQFGAIPEYWLGLTNVRDPVAYAAEMEAAEDQDQGLSEYEREQAERRSRRADFFDLCGYRYDSLEDSAKYDFSDIAPGADSFPGPHKITPYTQPEVPTYFSELDLKRLFSKVKELIDFACYCQRQKGVNQDGQHKADN